MVNRLINTKQMLLFSEFNVSFVSPQTGNICTAAQALWEATDLYLLIFHPKQAQLNREII